jgi:hypothetical protein
MKLMLMVGLRRLGGAVKCGIVLTGKVRVDGSYAIVTAQPDDSGASDPDDPERSTLTASRRYYSLVNLVYQPHLATIPYRSFFNLCRLKGISFDLEEREGTHIPFVTCCWERCLE